MFARIRGMSEEVARMIFGHGRGAYRAGKALTGGPHPHDTPKGDAWEAGWLEEEYRAIQRDRRRYPAPQDEVSRELAAMERRRSSL